MIEINQLRWAATHLLEDNPHHPSLHFKKVNPPWSARVGDQYRVLGKDVKGGRAAVGDGLVGQGYALAVGDALRSPGNRGQ